MLLVVLAIACVILVIDRASAGNSSSPGGGFSSPAAPKARAYAAAAAAVPSNRVTGSGTATIHLRGNEATITVTTTGLLNGSPHLMHIHAEGRGECPPASAARLHNGNLAISTADGSQYYGPPLLSLTEWGSTDGGIPNNIDFNRYPASGTIRYSRSITLPQVLADLIRDGNAVFVVHGIDYNHNDIYDFQALGVSDLDKTFPGEATAPALCGALQPQSTTARSDAPITTYAASLHLTFVSESRRPLFQFLGIRASQGRPS